MRYILALLLAIILNAETTADSPTSRPQLNTKLAGLPDNAWVYMDPAPYKRQSPTIRDANSPLKEQTVKEPPFREYTAPVYGDGKIFYFGGGHSGYPGNDMEIYDPVANAWRQCYPPHCPPRDDSTYYSGGSERCYVDPDTGTCEPFVLHGYARTSYHAGLRRYVCTAMFPTQIAQDPETKKWKLVRKAFSLVSFDEKTNKWELLGECKGFDPAGLSQYDAALGSVLGLGPTGVWLFKDGAFKPFGKASAPVAASGGAASVYLPEQKSHLIAVMGHGGKNDAGRLTLFSTTQKDSRELAVPEAVKKRFGTLGNFVLAYDSRNKQVIGMARDEATKPEVWAYDPADDKWEKQPAGVNAPSLPDVFSPACRAPLMYDPVHNVCFLALRNGNSVETWAYRYKNARLIRKEEQR